MKADQLFAASDGFFPSDSALSGPFLSRHLLPFSIWHSWILRVLESPYIMGGYATVDDYIMAVLVCSMDRSEFVHLLNDNDEMTKIFADLSILYHGQKAESRDDEVAEFHQYIQSGYNLPEYWEGDEADGKRARVPFEWKTVSILLGMGMCKTETEAWDYPLCRAACWTAVNMDGPLGPEYIDEQDREMIEKAKEIANGRA